MRYLVLLLVLCGGCEKIFGDRIHPPAGDAGDAGVPSDAGCACAAPPVAQCLDAGTLRTYSAASCASGACTYAHSDTTCQNGCAGAACVGDDPCTNVLCTTPPAASCTDPTELTSYSSSGTCAAGVCSYTSAMTSCTNGCSGGVCAGDPCAGVTCDQPPAAICTTSATRESYASVGTCSAGQCTYAPTDTSCTNGCSQGACEGDPCAGVTCNQPPAASCSGKSLVTYAASGTCTGGTCGYTSSSAACTAPAHAVATCASGACGFTCASGYTRSGATCVMQSTPDGGVTLKWTQEASTATTLLGVWGSGPSDVYAVGLGEAIFHSTDGSTWKSQQSGNTYSLYGVWGSSATDVYTVGTGGTILHTSDGGTTWVARTSGTTENLTSIWGSGPDNIYVVGSGHILHSTDGGMTWPSQASATSDVPEFLWGSSASNVYAVGYNSAGGVKGLVQHSTNGGTSFVDTDNLVNGLSLSGAWGTGPDDVWVVGGAGYGGGYLAHSTDGGTTWTRGNDGGTNGLGAVWGSGVGDFYVVGEVAAIFHTADGGSTWSYASYAPLNNAPTPTFNAVWGSGPDNVYVVGTTGAIIHGHE